MNRITSRQPWFCQRVKTVSEKSHQLVGYNVTCRLDGKDMTTRRLTKPGPTLQVKDGQVVTTPANS